MAEPFLKWAGGKAWLAPRIAEIAREKKIGRYYEPFLGAGAVFLLLAEEAIVSRATLGDSLGPLMNAWRSVKESPAAVISLANALGRDEKTYYEVRARSGQDVSQGSRSAADFIYLNKCGFNGLCRYNKTGGFNVPYGGVRARGFVPAPAEKIYACANALERTSAKLLTCDFRALVKDARLGDLVYFDPPYLPRSKTSNFSDYEPDGFGMKEHEALADLAKRLGDRGIRVILSNADVPRARELYSEKHFVLHGVQSRRSINSKGNGRSPVGELLIVTRSK